MSYLGRGTDKISNIEVLDNITFDGSSSYSITKSSVAFTPNSAQSLLISIDGVVQATNFSVSSSTIDFGVAVPSTSTCDFFLHYGTGLITVPADGTVSLDKLSATGTKDATTFLRGDNTFASAGLNGWSENGSNNDLLPASASAGIYLGVTSATASNLLDDYEEGTFTPTVADASSGGNVASGYAHRSGYYRKIGKMVFVDVVIVNINTSGMTSGNTLHIQDIPFAVANDNAFHQSYGTVIGDDFDSTLTNGHIVVIANAGDGTSFRFQAHNDDGGSAVALTVSTLTSTASDVKFSLSYMTEA